ncbi:hypothetical protein P4O66_009050 [Electrophorus voltai]|uniref:Uncharacterized protein n=1 Tax=Electrophorus voltai TaxID=2609070 RepID=A0AAD9DX02_9TELE|nr:hypothetical protein P4O66_009050 [Electrophorus voltai]
MCYSLNVSDPIVQTWFCEILAHSDVLPWELGCVFEWVLKDFLRRQEEAGHRLPMPPHQPPLLPVSPPPAGRSTSKWPAYFAPSSPDLQEGHREEIPTISSCVDRHVRRACTASVQRDSLPSCLFPVTALNPKALHCED